MNSYDVEYRFIVSPSPDPKEKIGRIKGQMNVQAENEKAALKLVRDKIAGQFSLVDEKSKDYEKYLKEVKNRPNILRVLFSKELPKTEQEEKDGCC